MKYFEFRCRACGKIFGELVSDEHSAAVCPVCGGSAERNWSGKIHGFCGASAHGARDGDAGRGGCEGLCGTGTASGTGGCTGDCSKCSGCGRG